MAILAADTMCFKKTNECFNLVKTIGIGKAFIFKDRFYF